MTLFASNPLWRFFQWLLGVRAAPEGEGQVAAVEWNAPWAPWLTLLLVVFAVVLVVFVYSRERTPLRPGPRRLLKATCITLRLAAIALVLLMLYKPMLQRFSTDLPDLVILLDDSESMTFPDPYDDEAVQQFIAERLQASELDEPTRLNLARSLLLADEGDLLAQLQRRYNVKIRLAGGSVRPLAGGDGLSASLRTVSAEQPASRLGKAVLDTIDAQRGRPTVGIVLLSDGITTEGQPLAAAARAAKRSGIPLFAIAVGNQQPLKNVAVADLSVVDSAFVGDTVVFEIKVAGGGLAGQSTRVLLKEKATSRVVDETTVTFSGDDQTVDVRLRHRPMKAGEIEYVVEAVPPPDDANDEDNSRPAKVNVSDETLRVLLVQSVPNYEFRYLKQLLSRQVGPVRRTGPAARTNAALGVRGNVVKKAVELTTVLQSAHGDYAAQDATAIPVFPVRREELFAYDVLIFGDVDPSLLSQSTMENIAAFVTERGGGVVFIAGPYFSPTAYRGTPLADLLPMDLDLVQRPDPRKVIRDSFRMLPSSEGLPMAHLQLGDSPAETLRRWQKLPGLYWFVEIPQLKPAARVLAEHDGRTGNDGRPLPMVVMQYVGAGKVIFHATDETWRWRFRIGDVLFGRYWMQTLRFLSRSKLIGQSRAAEITTDRSRYDRGEPVRLRVRFLDERVAPAQDDGVTVMIDHTGGRRRRVGLQRAGGRAVFETLLTNLPQGDYRVWVAAPTLEGGAPTVEFQVEPSGGELARLQADVDQMRRAAGISGGQFYLPVDSGQLIDDLPEGRQVPIAALDPVPIWNSHLLAGLLIAVLVGEWLLRKRASLL